MFYMNQQHIESGYGEIVSRQDDTGHSRHFTYMHYASPFFSLAHLWWVANQVELGNAQTHSGQHSFQAELKILSFFHVTGW